MIERDLFPRHKKVCIINDVPVRKEIETGDKFSAISNLNLLTAFRKGTLDIYTKNQVDKLPGITYKDIYTTYLDTTYYGEPEVEKNFDFNKEFKKRKELSVDADGIYYIVEDDDVQTLYVKLEHQKDVFISARLNLQLQGLLEEIRLVAPEFIIVTGKWSLFFLTGCTSLTQNLGNYKDKKPFGGLAKFRSSILKVHTCYEIPTEHILMPMYHTINAITMPDKRLIMDLDIQKICWMFKVMQTEGIGYYIRPTTNFIIGIDKVLILDYLYALLQRLDAEQRIVSVDIETKFSTTIDCIGISDKLNEGVCVPFAGELESSLWCIEDEIEILAAVYRILTHDNCLMLCQNGSYEQQFFYNLWSIRVKLYKDTMIQAHVLRNYLPKSLDFLASLYAEQYSYWKHMQVHK